MRMDLTKHVIRPLMTRYKLIDTVGGGDLGEEAATPQELLEGYTQEGDRIVHNLDGHYWVVNEFGEALDWVAVPTIEEPDHIRESAMDEARETASEQQASDDD